MTQFLNSNSKTNTRFKGFNWANSLKEVYIIGAGGTGSWIGLFLSKIGHIINVWDEDSFSFENLSGQFTLFQTLGVNKARALKTNTKAFGCDNAFHPIDRHWTEIEFANKKVNIVISCADSMDVRKRAFEYWRTYQLAKTERDPSEMNVFIDTRMSAVTGEIYMLTTSKHIKMYEQTLFSDNEAIEAPCNLKATTHCAATLAGLVVAMFNNHVSNKLDGFYIQEVPYKTTMNLNTMQIITSETND
jgi:UDP-N-acetylmuramoylalanine-D-glutamate ligase